MKDAQTITVAPDAVGIAAAARDKPGRLLLGALFMVVMVAIVTATSGPFGLLIAAVVLVPLLAAAFGYAWLHRGRARLELTPSELAVTDWLGRRRALPRGDVAAVAKVGYALNQQDGEWIHEKLAVVTARDGSAVSLGVKGWPERELVKVWRALGLPLDEWQRPYPPHVSELLARSPRTRLPFSHSRNTAFQLLLAVGVLVGLVVVVVVTSAVVSFAA